MNIKLPPIISLIMVTVSLAADARATSYFDQEPTNVPAAAVSDQPEWFRQITQLSGEPSSAAQLTIAVEGTVTLYLNGQRLAKDLQVTGTKTSWQVGSLLRSGRNSVAIAVDCDKASSVAAWFTGKNVPNLLPLQWKTTTAAPPVGWQKTDFNDRDWKNSVAAANLDQEILSKLTATSLEWASKSGESRVENGFVRFRDGDHVLMLGGTFIERAQSFGFLESAITCSTPGNVTFRNLGWSADTVFAESRGIFDAPAKGYERMVEHVRAEEPNVVLLCYGQNEAMTFANNAAGIDRYKQQLATLCNDLRTTGAEIILLSPHPFLDLQKPYPSPSKWNPDLERISNETRTVAASLGLHYVDLFTDFVKQLEDIKPEHIGQALIGQLPEHPSLVPLQQELWSDNGMHWNEYGYARVAHVVQQRLTGTTSPRTAVRVDLELLQVKTENGSVRNITKMPDGKVIEFELQSGSVTSGPVRIEVYPKNPDTRITATIQPNSDSANTVPLDLITVERESAESLVGFFNPDFETLRQLTIRKNELYFHRWRPQNITYLFGFRKHEQGNNASEIAQFDPLIAELEQQIAATKQPQWHKVIIQEAREN